MKPRAADPQAQALGRVSQWDAAKGLGFVLPDSGGERLLLRRADLTGRLRTRAPQPGEPVRFRIRADGGQRRAVEVLSLQAPPAAEKAVTAARRPPGPNSARLLVIPAFALVLGSIHMAWPLPRFVTVLYGALSTALFIVYGMDKWAARKGQPRVAEATLHGLALLGGWPGALLGQQVFRHKTSKPAFLRWTWAMACLNLLLLIVTCTPVLTPWLPK